VGDQCPQAGRIVNRDVSVRTPPGRQCAAPARVTILMKAEGGTQWEARTRAARMSRSLSRTRPRKGRAGSKATSMS